MLMLVLMHNSRVKQIDFNKCDNWLIDRCFTARQHKIGYYNGVEMYHKAMTQQDHNTPRYMDKRLTNKISKQS